MASLEDLRAQIERHPGEGRIATAIPRVTLYRSTAVTVPTPALYQPLLCIVVQGGKRVLLGNRVLDYTAGRYVVVSIDLPVSVAICQASPDEPYLSFSLALDPALLSDMLLTIPEGATEAGSSPGLAISRLTEDLLDPVTRMLRLLDQPDDIPMLAPLAEREILYRLLRGEQGPMLRQIALADGRLSQISRAIDWIRRHYDQPLRIEALAEVAGMSVSSFHRHFRAATEMSPLQFQKRIRLQEARRLLMSRDIDAARVGFTVGYESPSQFSREYSRLFGAPPRRDAADLRDLENHQPTRFARMFEEPDLDHAME